MNPAYRVTASGRTATVADRPIATPWNREVCGLKAVTADITLATPSLRSKGSLDQSVTL